MNYKREHIPVRYTDVLFMVYLFLNSKGDDMFTVSGFYEWYKGVAGLFYSLVKDKELVFAKIPSKKLISNEVARLYKMGFLSRKPRPRKVKTKGGKVVHKGIEYVYSMTKQGYKYIKYMEENMKRDEVILDTTDEELIQAMKEEGKIRDEYTEYMFRKLIEYGLTSEKNKENRLFTPKHWDAKIKELNSELGKAYIEVKGLKMEISDYKREIRELNEKIEELEKEILSFKREMARLKMSKEEIKKKYEKEIEEKDAQLKEKEELMKVAVETIRECNEKLDKCEEELIKERLKRHALEKQLKECQEDLYEWRRGARDYMNKLKSGRLGNLK